MVNVLLAGAVAMFVALFGTPLFIRFLVRRGYGQFIRDDGPTSHHTKRGTPTMGGAVIIGATLLGYGVSHLALILLDMSGLVEVTHSRFTISALPVLFLITGLGCIGFLDDYPKIANNRRLGLTSL